MGRTKSLDTRSKELNRATFSVVCSFHGEQPVKGTQGWPTDPFVLLACGCSWYKTKDMWLQGCNWDVDFHEMHANEDGHLCHACDSEILRWNAKHPDRKRLTSEERRELVRAHT